MKKITATLPIAFLLLAYVVAEGRDYAPPTLPQGDRYVSAQLFGVPDVPAHMVIVLAPSRSAILGERLPDEIVVTKPNPNKRVKYDYGWFPEKEFSKLDRASGNIDGETRRMRNQQMPEGCPIPKPIWEAINDLNETAEVKSIIAGAGWVESRWRVDAHHYDNDNGMSHGFLQLHGRWRKVDVDWMKNQPGGWKCPKNNLQAFLRTIKDHEKYYPQTKGSWRLKLSHYNGGKKGNLRYSDKCLEKAKELLNWFS